MDIIIIIVNATSSALPGAIGIIIAAVLAAGISIGAAKLVASWLCVAPALFSVVMEQSYGTFLSAGVVIIAVILCMIAAKKEMSWRTSSLILAVLTTIVIFVSDYFSNMGSVNGFKLIILIIFGIPLMTILLYPMATGLTGICSAPCLLFNSRWFLGALFNFISLVTGALCVQALAYLILGFFGKAEWCELAIRFDKGGFFYGLNVPFAMQQKLTHFIDALAAIPVVVRLLICAAISIPSTLFSIKCKN